MASWVQPLDDASRRVVIPFVTQTQARWQVDTAWVHFEGRTEPQAARTERETESWDVTSVWGAGQRTEAIEYLTLLRERMAEDDKRLEVHLEPLNGAFIDAVVMAASVPQQLAAARTDATVTFERVDPTVTS